jgi:cytochrome c oxidase assembly factor CtaG
MVLAVPKVVSSRAMIPAMMKRYLTWPIEKRRAASAGPVIPTSMYHAYTLAWHQKFQCEVVSDRAVTPPSTIAGAEPNED